MNTYSDAAVCFRFNTWKAIVSNSNSHLLSTDLAPNVPNEHCFLLIPNVNQQQRNLWSEVSVQRVQSWTKPVERCRGNSRLHWLSGVYRLFTAVTVAHWQLHLPGAVAHGCHCQTAACVKARSVHVCTCVCVWEIARGNMCQIRYQQTTVVC